MSAVRLVLVGVFGTLLLAGCSGGAPKATTVSRSAPEVTASQSTPPPVPVAAGKSYVEVLAGGNGVGAMREGLKLTAPNSVAYQYLDHTANMQEANIDEGGLPYRKEAAVPVGGGSFKYCNPDKFNCVTFGGFKVNQGGKLVDLTVNNEPVGPRLTMGNGQPVTAAGTAFTLLTAYQSRPTHGSSPSKSRQVPNR